MATATTGEHARYPHVFSPARVGPIELANRYYFSPHGVPLTVGCAPSNDLVSYCVERVRDGGCGLVILSCTAHERGRHFQPCPYPETAIPAFRALADAVHAAGGKIFAQIWYHWLRRVTGSRSAPAGAVVRAVGLAVRLRRHERRFSRGDARGNPADDRGASPVGGTSARGGLRRHRDPCVALRHDRAVPVALLQPPRRRIWRQPGKPHAPAGGDAGDGARGGGSGHGGRHALQLRRAGRGRL